MVNHDGVYKLHLMDGITPGGLLLDTSSQRPKGGGFEPPSLLQATGGTESTYTDDSGQAWKIYAFKSNGILEVNEDIENVDILIVGAGGGTFGYSGGGGAGGVIHLNGVTLPQNQYNISIGLGNANASGGNSTFATSDGSTILYTALGGGNGISSAAGVSGGSGSGGGSADFALLGGSSTQSSQSHTQLANGTIIQYGNSGGGNNTGSPYATGGGGGATGNGQNAQSSSISGNGGSGIDLSAHFGTEFGISGVFAGGGGGMARSSGTAGSGGIGGGGTGGSSSTGTAGVNYTGGGGGGGEESSATGLAGGHGIILVRIPS